MRKVAALALALLLSPSMWPAHAADEGLAARAQAALSTIHGEIELAGLDQSVEVLRDQWGVAHIYARDAHDLFFAQGFVAAQDRLFQMELWKRSGQGRLAEVLGPEALLRDVNARRLAYRGDLDAEYASYSPDTRQILEAFTAGINAYIARRNAPGGPGLPLEFVLAGFAPEPWRPEDCLNRMAAFSMTGNAFSELGNAGLAAIVGTERASRLLELDPPTELDAAGLDLSGLSDRLLQYLVGSDRRIGFSSSVLPESNNWTVSGALTASGKPLLANDPHRVIALPSLRYMVHLVAPGWDVIGAGEPGLPGVALGHNREIAWGFTIFGLDQQDLYLEELDPDDPLRYRTETGWARMEVRQERFAIRGGPAAEIELRFTRHGPVLWQDAHRALALRWVGAEPGTAGYLGSLAVDRAESWQEFEAAMARWKVPSENIVYADRSGNIGEHSTGLAPLRGNWNGLLPVPGSGGYEWSGFVPTGELPHSFNPAAGFIATANNRMIPDGYPYKVGYEWAPPFRVERIRGVLDDARRNGSKLDVAALERLQSDVVSLPGRRLVDLLEKSGDDSAPARLLHAWDGIVSADSSAAALYEVWQGELTTRIVAAVAPEEARREIWWSLARVLDELSQPSVEHFGTTPEAGRDRLLRDALAAAAEKLAGLQGSDPAKWSWGALHTARFRHPLDAASGAADLLDPAPVPRPGDDETVNATGTRDGGYEQLYGASYREILDLADWDRSRAVNVPGQSGQPGSPHYADLLPLWAAGEYFPLVYSRDAVERASPDRLVLRPAASAAASGGPARR